MLFSVFDRERNLSKTKTCVVANFVPFHEPDIALHRESAILLHSVLTIICRMMKQLQVDAHRLCYLISSSGKCILSIPVAAFHLIPTFMIKCIQT